jgi:hypothetical protein
MVVSMATMTDMKMVVSMVLKMVNQMAVAMVVN